MVSRAPQVERVLLEKGVLLAGLDLQESRANRDSLALLVT